MCLKQSCFSDCWKVSSVDPVFKKARESPTTKNYQPVSLLPLADPNLDLLYIWQLDTASFCENYAKLYFDAKHFMNWGW